MHQKKKKEKEKTLFWVLLPYIIIVIIACTAILSVIVLSNNRAKREMASLNRNNQKAVIELTTEEITHEENNSEIDAFLLESNQEIKNLINRYLTAIQTFNIEDLDRIVESKKQYNQEALNLAKEIIERFENPICYSIQGLVENTWLVYAVYDLKFKNMEETIPSYRTFYVCKDNNSPAYISDRALEGEQLAYLKEKQNAKDVRDLIRDIEKKRQEICNNNPDLAAVLEQWNTIRQSLTEE